MKHFKETTLFKGALTSCAVEFRSREYNVVTYNITLFVIAYIIPLTLIIFTNSQLVVMVKNCPIILLINLNWFYLILTFR